MPGAQHGPRRWAAAAGAGPGADARRGRGPWTQKFPPKSALPEMIRANYIAEHHERALANLNTVVKQFRTLKHNTQKYQTLFGDWRSVSELLQSCANMFDPYGSEAKRLNELSLCKDSKTKKVLNKGSVRDIVHDVFGIIAAEFFPGQFMNEQKPDSTAKPPQSPAARFEFPAQITVMYFDIKYSSFEKLICHHWQAAEEERKIKCSNIETIFQHNIISDESNGEPTPSLLDSSSVVKGRANINSRNLELSKRKSTSDTVKFRISDEKNTLCISLVLSLNFHFSKL